MHSINLKSGYKSYILSSQNLFKSKQVAWYCLDDRYKRLKIYGGQRYEYVFSIILNKKFQMVIKTRTGFMSGLGKRYQFMLTNKADINLGKIVKKLFTRNGLKYDDNFSWYVNMLHFNYPIMKDLNFYKVPAGCFDIFKMETLDFCQKYRIKELFENPYSYSILAYGYDYYSPKELKSNEEDRLTLPSVATCSTMASLREFRKKIVTYGKKSKCNAYDKLTAITTHLSSGDYIMPNNPRGKIKLVKKEKIECQEATQLIY